MEKWPYTRGLHAIGNNVYAYLQPDGSWGKNNNGYIDTRVKEPGQQNYLIDTNYDWKLTNAMHRVLREKIPSAATIDNIINTHGDGDHCFGNNNFPEARILASQATATEMRSGVAPQTLANMLKRAPEGAPIRRTLGAFSFDGIVQKFPDETFTGHKTLTVGDTIMELYEVGPAHTHGDTLIYLPQERVLFSGDIIFANAHPIIWAGPVRNWLQALNLILSLEVDVIVPGHGPLCDKRTVERLKSYFEYLYNEVEKCYHAGLSALDAAYHISYDQFGSWNEEERILANTIKIYKELDSTTQVPAVHELFALMAQWKEKKEGQKTNEAH